MRAHATHENGSAATGSTQRSSASGRPHLLTPAGALHLQRTAGNAAVSDAIAVQRKHIGSKEMLEFSEGTIEGHDGDGKPSTLFVTNGWLTG